MILSIFFLFFMLLLLSVAVFYLFCFFIPALKLKYDGISDTLATELQFTQRNPDENYSPDYTKIAFIDSTSSENELLKEKKLFYKGEKNCQLFTKFYVSEFTNPKTCIGFGDCVKICPQNAISIKNGNAEISKLCNACGKCLDFCPEKIITLVPREKKLEDSNEKGFKFWLSCYRLLLGGIKIR